MNMGTSHNSSQNLKSLLQNWNYFAFKQEVIKEYKARKVNEKHNVATAESAF